MEFYFSDSNLAKDRFMKNMIQSSENGCKYSPVSAWKWEVHALFFTDTQFIDWMKFRYSIYIYIYIVSCTLLQVHEWFLELHICECILEYFGHFGFIYGTFWS